VGTQLRLRNGKKGGFVLHGVGCQGVVRGLSGGFVCCILCDRNLVIYPFLCVGCVYVCYVLYVYVAYLRIVCVYCNACLS